MKLPDKDDKSMDFLDGCWNCRTGLSDTRGNPIKVRFCFGKNGKGQITIIDRQGKTYTGRADAQMQNGRLHIDTGDATSRNSRGSFNGLRIDCSPGAGNDAMCYGRNKGDNSPWSASFSGIEAPKALGKEENFLKKTFLFPKHPSFSRTFVFIESIFPAFPEKSFIERLGTKNERPISQCNEVAIPGRMEKLLRRGSGIRTPRGHFFIPPCPPSASESLLGERGEVSRGR
ncbi:MAG: hypothetical protein ACLTTU_07450 [Bilophila wadsworthia]